jgi:hypothetical protein
MAQQKRPVQVPLDTAALYYRPGAPSFDVEVRKKRLYLHCRPKPALRSARDGLSQKCWDAAVVMYKMGAFHLWSLLDAARCSMSSSS